MKCPECNGENLHTIDSRWGYGFVKRRRECKSCGGRFNTLEITEKEYNKIMRKVTEFEEIAHRARRWDFDVGEER